MNPYNGKYNLNRYGFKILNPYNAGNIAYQTIKTKMSKNYNPKIHHRQSTRLKNYDYASDGYYFATICVKNKIEYFGEITNGKMELSEIGKIANQCWLEIPKHFPSVKLDEHIIMPNHLHGILIIETSVGVQDFEPLQQRAQNTGAQDFVPPQRENKFQHIISKSFGSIIRGFKVGVAKLCIQNNYEFQWQKSFYDHIIRDEKSLNKIRKYIVNNPAKWELDKNNPENLFM